MKTIVLSVLMVLCYGVSYAGVNSSLHTPVSEVAFSSVTGYNVSVTTNATRIDHGNNHIMSGRVFVRLCNVSTCTAVNFNYDVSVSTTAGEAKHGETLDYGQCKNVNVSEYVTIYGRRQGDSGTVNILSFQAK